MLMLSVSGCRGVVGETLTPSVAASFAGAYASFLREHFKGSRRCTVVLGRDGRRGCEVVHHAAVAGLLGAGCDVVDLGVAMTPTVAVMTDRHRRESGSPTAGMVLTASHNPQQWNGLKCLLADPAAGGLHGAAACAPPAVCARQIIDRFQSGRTTHEGWNTVGVRTTASDGTEAHVERVQDALISSGLATLPSALAHGLRVAVDCVNASASRTAPILLGSLGCENVTALNCETTGEKAGLFPHAPEPTADNLSGAGGLCDAVRTNRCDVGFALDPDADRLALIDEQGRYVGEEYTLALSALAILEARKRSGGGGGGGSGGEQPVLVTNLSTSRMINDVAARYGVRVLRTPVGEANVVEVMKRENAIAGGEGNGGTIWPRSCYVRDSLAAMGLVLWLLSPASTGRRRTLSELVASIPAYAIEKRKVDLARKEDAQAAVEKITRAYAAQGQHVDTSDGAWVDFRNGPLTGKAWLHVRASNTEPIMRLIAEAPTREQAAAVLDQAKAVIAAP
ncbi:MAG TPA: phosphoglucosamine mutase [Phycisphaerales bacterium]|nr:phosphoglucosamine mutase [Phycisphaerales bacterium]